MSKQQLFVDSEESDEDVEFKTNEDYAKLYKHARKRELLQKFKDRGNELSESELDSTSDSSDDNEPEDPKFDEQFFSTLASLKNKDPVIYDKKTTFFEDAKTENLQHNDRKEKQMTIKDFERKVLLETKGQLIESDSENEEQYNRAASPTIAQEDQQLVEEFKKVVNDNDEQESDEEFGGIFKKREKTEKQKAEEEVDYIKWLRGQEESVKTAVHQKLEPLKNYWKSNKLTREEQFLRDYILNKGYANTKSSDIPTYEEIVNDVKAELSEDEHELEKQEEFEHKYNFRFEEPDVEFIKRYPRTIESTVRRTEGKRKEKRIEHKERKALEKEQKMRELEMVKEMKRKEIKEKIEKLKLITGNEQLGIRDDELEEDFDPEAHDRRMQQIFDDNYYAVKEDGEEKPECPSDIEELEFENWNEYRGDEADDDDIHCENEDFNMDCEYDPQAAKEKQQQELIEKSIGRKGRKGRRRSKFMEMISAEKPRFDPEEEKTYAEYINEYYKIDCEDFIEDLPCRFKYVQTTPNDFGLSVEEILLAKNSELNKWASLKKAIQIRPESIEKKEARLYRLKAKNEELKRKIFKSIYGENSENENSDTEEKEKTDTNQNKESINQNSNVSTNKKKKRNKKRKIQTETVTLQSSATESAEKKIKLDDESNVKTENAIKKIKLDIVENAAALKPQQSNSKSTEVAKNTEIEKTRTPAKNMNKQIKNKSKIQIKNPFGKPVNLSDKRNLNIKTVNGANKKNKKFVQKQKHGKVANASESNQLSNERFKAYGINPRKFHAKRAFKKNKT